MRIPRLWQQLFVTTGIAALGLVLALGLVANAETKREPKLDTAAIEKKLNEVLSNQALILQRLDELKAELQIVKVRATR